MVDNAQEIVLSLGSKGGDKGLFKRCQITKRRKKRLSFIKKCFSKGYMLCNQGRLLSHDPIKLGSQVDAFDTVMRHDALSEQHDRSRSESHPDRRVRDDDRGRPGL